MTITAEIINSPKLREKDSYCVLSYFDGYDEYSPTATTGNYVNTGSAGNISDLQLRTDSASVRLFGEGIGSVIVPEMRPNLYKHGLSTYYKVTTGESSTITMELWVKQNYINSGLNEYLFMKRYYATYSWSSPYMSICLVSLLGTAQLGAYYATSSSSFGQINSGAYIPLSIWTHVGLTWTDGGDIKIYMNGIKVKTETSKTMYYGNHGGYGVGGRGGISDSSMGLNNEGFFGYLSGVRWHSVIRSDDWFRETYNLGKNQV